MHKYLIQQQLLQLLLAMALINRQELRKDIHASLKSGDIFGARMASLIYVASGELPMKQVKKMWAVKVGYQSRISYALEFETLRRAEDDAALPGLRERSVLAGKNFNIVAGAATKDSTTTGPIMSRPELEEIASRATEECARVIQKALRSSPGAFQ
jgi:hypothetical protein